MPDQKIKVVIYKLQKEEREMSKEEALSFFNSVSKQEKVKLVIRPNEPNVVYIVPEILTECPSLEDTLLFISDVKELAKYATLVQALLNALQYASTELKERLEHFVVEEFEDSWGDEDDF